MKTAVAIAALFLPACFDMSTRVNVAPSAHDDAVSVLEAALRLNEAIGYDAYSVALVDHEHRIDGEVIVRGSDVPLKPAGRRGKCQITTRGVIVTMGPDFQAQSVAHELGHAAGLKHHDDESNLMFETAEEWDLTEDQISVMLEAL